MKDDGCYWHLLSVVVLAPSEHITDFSTVIRVPDGERTEAEDIPLLYSPPTLRPKPPSLDSFNIATSRFPFYDLPTDLDTRFYGLLAQNTSISSTLLEETSDLCVRNSNGVQRGVIIAFFFSLRKDTQIIRQFCTSPLPENCHHCSCPGQLSPS